MTGAGAPRRDSPRVLATRVALAAMLLAGVALALPSGFGVLWFVPYAGVGAVLVSRRPRMSIGWILLLLGWAFVAATFSLAASPAAFDAGAIDLPTAVLAAIAASGGAAAFYLFALLAIVFPTGHLPTGAWGVAARIGLLTGLVALGLGMVMPVLSVSWSGSSVSVPVRNPVAILPDLPIWRVITPDTVILPIVALLVAAACSLVVRYRRATGIVRLQLRWLTSAVAFIVVSVILGFVATNIVPALADSGVAWIGAIVGFPMVPVAIWVAITRYRLWEIDRIVSRTIGWAMVTALLLATFAAAVIALQGLLAGVTQGQTLAVAASTLLAFALFQPIRRRVQRAVDGRFDRARYDAERVITMFSERMRDEIDLEAISGEIRRTAGEAVRPSSSAIWLRTAGAAE